MSFAPLTSFFDPDSYSLRHKGYPFPKSASARSAVITACRQYMHLLTNQLMGNKGQLSSRVEPNSQWSGGCRTRIGRYDYRESADIPELEDGWQPED